MKQICLVLLAAVLLLPVQAHAAQADVRLVAGEQDLLAVGRVLEAGDILRLEPVYYVISSAGGESGHEIQLPQKEEIVVELLQNGDYSYLQAGEMVLASLERMDNGSFCVRWGIYAMLQTEPGQMRIAGNGAQGRALIEGFLNDGRLYSGESRQEIQAFARSGGDYREATALLIPAGEEIPAQKHLGAGPERENKFWYFVAIAAAVAFATAAERKLRTDRKEK